MIRKAIANQSVEFGRDWLTLVLGGLGVSLAPYEFFGGHCLSAPRQPDQTDRHVGHRHQGAELTVA